MLRNDGYTKEKFVAEFVSLWGDMVRDVYLREPEDCSEMGEEAFSQTKFSPLEYIEWIGDPSNLINKIGRGQKAREQRWQKWLRSTHHLRIAKQMTEPYMNIYGSAIKKIPCCYTI